MQIFVSAHRFFMTHSFTMRTLFKECEDVITVKDHDNRELITVNLRLINEFSHKALKKET
jgi:hypothetical protein